MKNNKFKLTDETKNFLGKKLYRIEALKDFGSVSKGDKGGWIEKEENISVYGDAWVSGDAWVYGDARVYGNAQVYGDARVSGNAQVSGDAWVYGALKLEAGFFFGVKWKSDTEIKQIEIEDGNYLVYKGKAKFGTNEPEVTEMTVAEINKALGKIIKIVE